MDSIKKKMQAMKLEKENAVDRADQAEQRQKEFEEKLKGVSEECWSSVGLPVGTLRSFVCLVRRRKQYFTKTYSTNRSRTRCCH
jgi:hypothetical protein